ncbi:hypothetical protein BJ508DRAFT_335940 [Ascobolus immersus RN42]|uniref:Uncharacterized protein n=1 Tax=Ascobolus immersus RN42 TaxID=1160509 RepID=A0A3N4HGM6_ASCIM|nr:hypothetical protein BJ508DRAFT_335940 [Ascobolus immersus RN42]
MKLLLPLSLLSSFVAAVAVPTEVQVQSLLKRDWGCPNDCAPYACLIQSNYYGGGCGGNTNCGHYTACLTREGCSDPTGTNIAPIMDPTIGDHVGIVNGTTYQCLGAQGRCRFWMCTRNPNRSSDEPYEDWVSIKRCLGNWGCREIPA